LSRSPHGEFLELCALSTSGQLTAEESARLQEHLAVCPSCREVMKQYDVVVSKTIPALAPDPENVESDPSWPQEQAEAAFFQRLTLEEELGADRGGGDGDSPSKAIGRVPLSASQITWRNVWALCAAGVLLCIALGVSAYQVGIRRGVRTAAFTLPADQTDQAALDQQVSDAGYERQVLRTQIELRDKEISSLRQELEQQAASMSRMKLAQTQLEADFQTGQAGRQDLLQQRSDLSRELEAAQVKAQGLQDKMDLLERQSSEDKQRATTLEAKVFDLNRMLRDHEATIDQQQELLSHDRDIRDLMGARDLYVAEVYDVERTGETRKPYGRVFYTKGKSLIFYAYDLDQQPGVKNASTFQAWGRRGADRERALNLGIFYVDNASKKRWVLRFDDPKALAQIDAVFVTVEPNGGSHKPSNKPLLFAYLHIDPNHP
jgi:hypothetical protein